MKDRYNPKRKLFTICRYLFPFQRYELSKSQKSWEKLRQENWTFCAPLTKIVTSHVGLLLIQYLNQMSFRHYWSESSKTWYTYETRWEELQNIKYFVAMATFSVRAFINQKHNYLIFYSPVGPQWSFSCFWYALALLDQLLTATGWNCLPVRN